ncbi:MAG: hypothetical protein M1835_004407 [Candelina submexicana]|nr:MAG: hypothetical protein M1835_004407 [Candelina submexicana]
MSMKAVDRCSITSPVLTLLPFLYKTQTLRTLSRVNTSSWIPSQPRHTSTNAPEKTAIYRPIGQDVVHAVPRAKLDNPIPPKAAQPVPDPRPPRETTITSAEHEIFTRIFDDIAASSAKEASSFPPEDIEFVPSSGSKRQVRPGDEVSSILADAVEAGKSGSSKSTNPRDHSLFEPPQRNAPVNRRSERIRQAVERYPPTLRAAAARALFARQQQVEQTQSTKNTLEKLEVVDDHIQFVRHRELMKVEDMLNAAKTDMDVWKIVDEEVFSTIKKLNDELGEPVAKTKRKGRKTAKGRKKDSAIASEESKLEDLAQEKEVPLLSITGPNYPAHLLVAARLFRHEFPASPLALALLPAIKKHGPISYVLGASTALHNELIHILWKTYGDFNGIDELLKDMDKGGVEFNEATLVLLQGIEKEKMAIRKGQHGRALEALWKMQGMSATLSALGRWKTVIKARLSETEMTAGSVRVGDDDEDNLGEEHI